MRRISPNLQAVPGIHNHLGETPVWSAAESVLYWVNVEGPPELFRWDPNSGAVKSWPMPERLGGFVFKQGGGALLALASGIYDFDFASGALTLRAKSPIANAALHECACDPSGRFWVGSIDMSVSPDNLNARGGKFFRLEGNELVPVLEGFGCANGLAFDHAGRYLYLADSASRQCRRFDLNLHTGALSNAHTLFELGPDERGFPDGAAFDTEGGYWNAFAGGGRLRRYLPDGTIDVEVTLPFENPTKVTFGGEAMRTMFVTSTEQLLGAATISPMNGGLYAFEPGATGFPEPMFRD